MKKLRMLLVMLFGLLCPLAFAQSAFDYELDEEHPLINSVDQLSSPYSVDYPGEGELENMLDGDPDTYWHTSWYQSVEPHYHYLQVDLLEPQEGLISLKFTRRWHNYQRTALHYDDHVTVWSVCGANDPTEDDADWMEVAVLNTPFGEPGETMNTIGFDTKGYRYLRFFADETTTGRGFWHVAEFQLYPCQLADEKISALRELIDVYFQYEKFEAELTANIGDNPGQYSPEAVYEFVQALRRAQDIDSGGGDDITVEEIKALIETIKTTYQAAIDSLVPFTLADGYYRIRCGLKFTNFFPTDKLDEMGEPVLEERLVDKYMYSVIENDVIYARWNTPDDLDNDCPSLWKITNKDGYYDIVNCATDGRFNNVARSSNETMSKDSPNLMAFDLCCNIDGTPYIHIRVSTQEANNYLYLHGAGHQDGVGTGGSICGWTCTHNGEGLGASEWVFDLVAPEKAEAIITAYEPYKNQAAMVENFMNMLEDGARKLEIAKDLSYSQPLIADVSQLSSPWSAGHDFEGNIAHVIDGDPLTYWHTRWTDNSNRHYLQVELKEPVYRLICMKFTRRLYNYNSQVECTTNHPIEWGFYGSDDPDADEADWTFLADMQTPYNAPGETIVTDGFDPQGKKYLRIYGENNTDGNRYWHVAELQLYPSPIETIDSPTSQYHMMGDVATTLEEVITRYSDILGIGVNEYNELKSAYDAFIAVFVDPNPLRAKIEEVKDADNIIEVGNDPGFWKDKSASDNLSQTIATAQNYDKGGVYTAEQSQAYIDNLDAAAANVKGSANPVETGKWYRFRFGTEQEYADHNWNTNGNQTDYRVVNGENTVVINEEIFGKYMTVARLERFRGEDELGSYTQNVVVPVDADEVHVDDQLYFDALEDIENPDLALFRFVPVGDGYAIQNKATGLYLQKKTETNDGIYLSVHPSLFAQEVVGNGQNAMFITTLNGERQNPLHFARNTNVVITYGSYGNSDGRRGCYYIETAGDVEADYAPNTTRLAFWEGTMNARCYPVTMKAVDETDGTMWTVAALVREEATDDTPAVIKVTLAPIGENNAVAGRPFIYVKDGEYIPVDERLDGDEPELVEFTFGDDFVTEPVSEGPLKGVFTNTTVGAGVLTVGDTKVSRTESLSATVNTDRAYIAEEEALPRNYKFEVVFDETIEDGITSALQKVAKAGGVYTIDGRLIDKHGNINTLRNAAPGIYIVNGVKVVVK